MSDKYTRDLGNFGAGAEGKGSPFISGAEGIKNGQPFGTLAGWPTEEEDEYVLDLIGITPEEIAKQDTVDSDWDLLDHIAKNEGTYKTGYNTEYNYGKNGSPRKDLSEMTIDEVMAYQDTMSGPSTAMGRYQMLKQTIIDEKKAGGYSGSELFTNEVQDKMIMNRLKRRRGYDSWKSGDLPNDDFQFNLSQEFASIPNPKTGVSYYGDQPVKDWNWGSTKGDFWTAHDANLLTLDEKYGGDRDAPGYVEEIRALDNAWS